MKARHPSEFIYAPINLMPLIEAAKAKDWVLVNSLLESGYSLLWTDSTLKETAIRILAREAVGDEIVLGLLDISIREHGINSKAHIFAVTEAIIGRRSNIDGCDVNELSKRIDRSNYMECENTAEMEASSYIDMPHTLKHIKITPEVLFHLCRGGHDTSAIKLLETFKGPEVSKRVRYQAIAAIMRGVARNRKVDIDSVIVQVRQALEMKGAISDDPLYIAVAEAIVNEHDDWAFKKIAQPRILSQPNLDVILGEAVISAARYGRADIIFQLCQIMKQTEETEKFKQLLSCAAGAALVNEHFSLAKIILQMVPEFNAKPEDLAELNAWPQCKVKRMLSLIRDCKMFTDIALHSGIAANVNSPEWLAALKEEYGLNAMSNDGFNKLMHNTDMIKALLQHRGQDAVTNNIPLTPEDIKIFQIAAQEAKEKAKKTGHINISFFRLNQLVMMPNTPRENLEAMKNSVKIRAEIDEILSRYQSKSHLFSNGPVLALVDELHGAVNTNVIHQLLLEKLSAFGHKSLLKECLDVLNRHGVNTEKMRESPAVTK
jgi:hypothetical protein